MRHSQTTASAAGGRRLSPSSIDRPLLGIGLMALGVSIVPLMDGIAKMLSTDYHVLQIVWGRFTFNVLWLIPLLLWRVRPRELLARRPGLQLLRGAFSLGATLCFFSAIARMPLADALALLFIAPMVTTMLSPLILRETVSTWRWVAVAAGFTGALIVIRPGFGVFQWASLLALGAGVCHGCYMLTTRYLSGSTRPVITLLYTAVLGCVVMSLTMPAVWNPPSAVDWGWMAATGLLATGGHFLIIKAFEQASAPIVAPVAYGEIVAATAVGFFVFGDFPDAWTWLGIAVIVASGITISLREGGRRPVSTTADSDPSGALH